MSAQNTNRVIAGEDFDGLSHNKWPISSSESKSAKIENNAYHIKIDDPKINGFFTIPIQINNEKDYIIKADFSSVNNYEKSFYGIVFGATSQANSFLFAIDTKQSIWMFAKVSQNKFTPILPWSKLETTNTEASINELTVIAMNGYWYFRINNETLKKAPIEPFMGNQFGVFSAGLVDIKVNNFYVTEEQ